MIESYPLVLGADKKLDSRALATFLLKHKPPTRDAETMVSEALVRAKTENKRVFLIMSASWCGPCRMLARFLSANKHLLDRYYIFVKLDVSRDKHADILMKRYQGKNAWNGVPWYVILGATGEPIIASNMTEPFAGGSTNIGFPSSKVTIDYFMMMLRKTAPGISEVSLNSLRNELEKKR